VAIVPAEPPGGLTPKSGIPELKTPRALGTIIGPASRSRDAGAHSSKFIEASQVAFMTINLLQALLSRA
jgi:hypothetical protein